ncbi:hypothetical protein ACS127_04640 [Amphibacillus sp. Q70]|uniref:hypothetical protein n=1 Tax=Amphibacillus sp. Q70 TaxID=3453416 RepID=UPI003F842147
MRQDIKVIEHKQNKKNNLKNVYVGDIETADQIICTYYDTPPQSFGPYYLFDRKRQSKAITKFILVSSLFTLLVGTLLTLFYMKNSHNAFDFTSFNTVFVMVCYGIYFYLLSKVAKGLSNRNNLVRNTSSILTLLALIDEVKSKKIAFAFVDEGCFGEAGLEAVKETCKASAKIYWLDCVGADLDLHFIGHVMNKKKLTDFTVHPYSTSQVNYIFSGRSLKADQELQYYLEKSELKQKALNSENLTKIIKLFT